MGALSWESLQRLGEPATVNAPIIIKVALLGVVINGVTAWLFMRGSRHDLNVRGAFLHMAADSLVSAGVVLAGLLYLWFDWHWIDPVVSLLIAFVIILGTARLLRESLHLLFDGVPAGIDLESVKRTLCGIKGVNGVHDLHVWALSSNQNALTAHLDTGEASGEEQSEILSRALALLEERFDLDHVTLQLEGARFAGTCNLKADGCSGCTSGAMSR